MAGMIFTVPQGHVAVVERLGRFARVCNPGLAFKLPFIESIRTVREWEGVANKQDWLIEITEQQSDTNPRTTHTKDNVELTAAASVYWRIVDPRAALYEVDRLPPSIADIALNALRSAIGTMSLDEALSRRQELNDNVARQLDSKAAAWGVKISRVEVQELQTSNETSDAMLQQMSAERRKRAMIYEAEGQASAIERVAEAEKNAAILRAEGDATALLKTAAADAKYLDAVGRASSPSTAAQTLLAQKVLTGYSIISNGAADKVFLPSSFQGMFNFDIQSGDNGSPADGGPTSGNLSKPESPRPTTPKPREPSTPST